MTEFARLQLRIAPERIHFLKFILEGYDGLAVQSTVDARRGVVEIRYPLSRKVELDLLLASLVPAVGGTP